ncbi:MAG: hypothetical protein IM638_19670 [Bacteroidetes bacterium]|nr:hypothetical protein [Bacteroidota bacterium]
MSPGYYFYIAIIIFVLIYRMYRNAVKAQKRSTGSSQVPQQRQASQQQVDQWLRQVVLSNQVQAQQPQQAHQSQPTAYASYSSEETIDEMAGDAELSIETELHEFENRNTSPQNTPDGLNFVANISTSLPATDSPDWQNAVIMSELLNKPKAFQ